ncbi:MAG: D-glycero-beta-D-manno-heptose 1,7-bisphosphate 7-phosphatase [Pseudomonadota bacterium]
MNPWVILDRDGVINRDSPDYIRSLSDWHPLPGSIEAIARLCRSGFRVVVATNQSGVGRGLIQAAELAAIHGELCRQVARAGGEIAGIFYCPHAPEAGCSCRKPATGLFQAIARRFSVNLSGAAAIGDSLRDLQAARAAGCRPMLVRTGNGRAAEMQLRAAGPAGLGPVPIYADLAAAADALTGAGR